MCLFVRVAEKTVSPPVPGIEDDEAAEGIGSGEE
jgi:hypothetical protein